MTEASYLELSYWQVALATALIVANGAISVALRLGLGKRLVLAAVRATVQLLLVGLVLEKVFQLDSAPPVVALMLVMVAVAGLAAVRRTRRRYPGVWLDALLSIAVSALVVSGLALTVVVRVEPWYRPQYAIPFLGMVLGNGLTGISLGLDRLLAALTDDRQRVETWLALGATWWEAALPAVREAVRTGMIPILNAMTVAGLVSLPGMMTGQLLAGVAPVQAVRYQIVILFVIAAATASGTVAVVLLGARRLFDRDHRFRAAAIRDTGSG